MDEEDIKIAAKIISKLAKSKEFEISTYERDILQQAAVIAKECA